MKIFNWMHQKLLWSNDYCKVLHVAGEDKFNKFEHETKMSEVEKKALLLEPSDMANLHQALDCTILSIGTFGRYHDSFCKMEEEGEEEGEEEKEEEGRGGDKMSETQHDTPANGEYRCSESQKQEQQESSQGKLKGGKNNDYRKNEKPVRGAATVDLAVEKVAVAENDEKLHEPLLSKKVDHVERTTLLDLFLESDGLARERTTASRHIKTSVAEKVNVAVDGMATSSSSYAKKLASRERENKIPYPAVSGKVRQLATKMMRKKIHPEANSERPPAQKPLPIEQQQFEHEKSGADGSTPLLWWCVSTL